MTATDRETMLLDGLLASFDATRIEHRVLPCGLPEAYEAVRQADFMRAWRDSAAVRALFALRGAGERAAALARRRAPIPAPEVAELRPASMPTHGDWVLLGEDPPYEIHEARTATTDEPSRLSFLRYWRALAPFIGVVMRSHLGVVAGQAASPSAESRRTVSA